MSMLGQIPKKSLVLCVRGLDPLSLPFHVEHHRKLVQTLSCFFITYGINSNTFSPACKSSIIWPLPLLSNLIFCHFPHVPHTAARPHYGPFLTRRRSSRFWDFACAISLPGISSSLLTLPVSTPDNLLS